MHREEQNSLYTIFAEDDMPKELHHPPALCITLLCVDDPVSEVVIIAQRPLSYLILRHGKLRTARSAYLDRELVFVRCSPLENILPHFRRDMCIIPMSHLAAGVPIASQVHIAVALYERDLEGFESINVVMVWGVGVPSGKKPVAVGV